ncbi:MAG: elongation factor EF-2 [Candidatus Bathyarchaeia archaeon]
MSMFRQTEQILSVAKNKERIRNIGIIAHIDHGKTTLTDSLLAEAGLIPHGLAGKARVLDYLEEEQRRGITIKAANISLLYDFNGSHYVVNLIDTPGHVDFTGRVTRALRIIDGAIVLVDAVEEIMAQTEVVVRQALNERVKPVLFINKIDRLITNLRLSAEKIQEKISRIIQGFNDLIEIYGEKPFKEAWKVSLPKGNVAFGSALHGWGLTFDIAREKGLRFSDIIEAYKDDGWLDLQEKIPLHRALLKMVIEKMPDPCKAQKYRIPKIWRGDLNSEVGKAMLECSSEGPMAICVTSVKSDSSGDMIATGRIFSGEINSGDRVYLLGAGRECVVNKIWIYMGAFKEAINHQSSGNIVALSELGHINTGETIVDVAHKEFMTTFEKIHYVSEPVVTVSLEPKNPPDLLRLIDILKMLSIEDPNIAVSINRETGEYLLSGVGELHLDVAIKSIKEHAPDIEVIVSKPIIAYRESVSSGGANFTSNSPNGLNRITVRVEPLERNVLKILEETGEEAIKHSKVLFDRAEHIIAIERNTNLLVDSTEGGSPTGEDLEAIIEGFRWACQSGPLCGEPVRGLKVKLLNARLHESQAQKGYAQLIPATKNAIFGSFLTAHPILLEPVCKVQISTPAEQIGDVVNLIVRKRGKILSIFQREFISIVDGYMPIAESLGLADELRSVSSGRAFWQSMFSHWEKIPDDIMMNVIRSIRWRKGLPPETPDAKRLAYD